MEQFFDSYGEIVRIKNIVQRFKVCDGEITHVDPINTGRINSTYKITIDHNDDTTSYMLQRINTFVFNDVSQVMYNAITVSEHLRNKGMDSLEFIYTKDDKPVYYDGSDVYRMTKFIHAEVFQNITRPKDMRMLGYAVGIFSVGLEDFDARILKDTIPDFHNTQKRYEAFLLSALKNVLKKENTRAIECEEEIDFVTSNKELYSIIVEALLKGDIPLRVTHNDTKLNNVLFDRKTNVPRCLIDLDTVMGGSILYDLGDAMRSGGNTSSEDERNTSKVKIDLELVKEFLIGFNSAAPNLLTPKEIELLPLSVLIITLELGIRFLTDYFDGDKYFGITEPDDNLVRARVQFALARDIIKKMDDIKQIVKDVFHN